MNIISNWKPHNCLQRTLTLALKTVKSNTNKRQIEKGLIVFLK